jgi:small subunit ribosomal protein S6
MEAYEVMVMFGPEVEEPRQDEVIARIRQIAEGAGGTFQASDNWGRRKLAYEIGHAREGTYVIETISGSGEMMKEIDRRLRVTDTIIRHLTVRVDEAMRVADRLRSERKATQARRRTARGLPPEPQASERRGDRDNDDQDDGVMGLEAEGQR